MSMDNQEFKNLGFGAGFRKCHRERILSAPTRLDWFEVISENYMGNGGRPLYFLDKVRENEFRKGVNLKAMYKDQIVNINLEKLKEYAAILERFISSIK